MANEKGIRGDRLIGLDLFRIALAVLILLFHSRAKSHFSCYYYVLDDFISMGAIAMTAFFMLSGYSLYLVYGKEDFLSIEKVKTFYIKRFINIAPLYFFVTLVYLVFFSKETPLQLLFVLPVEVLTIQAELNLTHVFHNGGTWFISCLTICYFIYPFIQWVTNQISDKGRVKTIIFLSFIILLSPFVGKMFDVDTYPNPFIRLLEFCIGILLSQLNTLDSGKNKILDLFRTELMLALSIIALVAGITLVIRMGFPKSYQAYNIIALPCFIVMMLSLSYQKFEIKHTKTILYMSKVSYAFFMTQIFLWPLCQWLITKLGHDTNMIRIALSFVTCSIISILMYEIVDKPVGKYLRNRLMNNI